MMNTFTIYIYIYAIQITDIKRKILPFQRKRRYDCIDDDTITALNYNNGPPWSNLSGKKNMRNGHLEN